MKMMEVQEAIIVSAVKNDNSDVYSAFNHNVANSNGILAVPLLAFKFQHTSKKANSCLAVVKMKFESAEYRDTFFRSSSKKKKWKSNLLMLRTDVLFDSFSSKIFRISL